MKKMQLSGRDKEINWICGAWGNWDQGPRIRVILAESGYGKTKLAQAFYQWLTINHDSEGYWPKNLLSEANNLRVMPELREIDKQKSIPWFWWGLRFGDPGLRNRVDASSPFVSCLNEAAFRSHQESILREITERQALKEAGISAAKVLLGWTGLDTINNIVNAVDQIQGFLGILNQRKSKIELADSIQIAEENEIERVLLIFSLLMDGKLKNSSLPVVLLLDDSQWVDDLSIRIFDRLWQEATKKKWPLLVLATSWEREWHQYKGFAACVKDISKQYVGVTKLQGLQSAEISGIVLSELPGLSESQVDLICEKVDGNPRHALELVAYLKKRKNFFVGQDIGKPISNIGIEKIRDSKLSLEQLEEERFLDVEQGIREALACGSIQGEIFLCEFAKEIAGKLKLPVEENHYRQAEVPFALTESMDSESMVFRSKFLQKIANSEFEGRFDSEVLEHAFSQVFNEWSKQEKIGKLNPNRRNGLCMLNYLFSHDIPSKICAIAQATRESRLSGNFANLSIWIKEWEALDKFSVNPKNVKPAALCEIAQALLILGNDKEACEILSSVSDADLAGSADERADVLAKLTHANEINLVQNMEKDEIERNYFEVISLREKAIADQGKTADLLRKLSMAHLLLGQFYVLRGSEGAPSNRKLNPNSLKDKRVMSKFQKALDIIQEALDLEPDSISCLNHKCLIIERISDTHKHLGDYKNAENELSHVVALRQKANQLNPENDFFKCKLAKDLLKHCDMLLELERLDEACEAAERAEKILKTISNPTSEIENRRVNSIIQLGACDFAKDRLDSMREKHRLAMELCNQAIGRWPNCPKLKKTRIRLKEITSRAR